MGGRTRLVLCTHVETFGKIHWVFQQESVKVPLSFWTPLKKTRAIHVHNMLQII